MMKLKKRFYDPARDGVTFSLLSTFLDCREKARLYLEGWSGAHPSFHLVFGSFAHYILRQAYSEHRAGTLTAYPKATWVYAQLEEVRRIWNRDHPHPNEIAAGIVEEAIMKAGAILPSYFEYWKKDFEDVAWMEVEETFHLPWSVPIGDHTTFLTYLRGRIDAAYQLPGAKSKRGRNAPRLFETKTRNTVDEETLIDTMPHERQTNTYLTALRKKTGTTPASVLLNIIRKPLLRQKQTESWEQFEKRIRTDVETRKDWYFLRMEMTVDPEDIDRSEKELDALIKDFVLWWHGLAGHYKNSNMCRPPGSGPCPYLKVCSQNDYHGLEKRNVIFRELEDE